MHGLTEEKPDGEFQFSQGMVPPFRKAKKNGSPCPGAQRISDGHGCPNRKQPRQTMVLVLIAVQSVKYMSANSRRSAACTAQVDHLRLRGEPDQPPLPSQAKLQVRLLCVHEEHLIKSPRLLTNRPTQEKTGAADKIDKAFAVVIPFSVASQGRVIGKQA